MKATGARQAARPFFSTVFLIIISLSFLSASARAEILRFRQVDDGVFRSSELGEESDVETLVNHGIRTVINIRTSSKNVERERPWMERAGIRYLTIPVSSIFAPSKKKMTEIFEVLRNPENHPILLHCQHGKDRTGLIMGLYRVHYQQWTRDEAYAEMREIGFDPRLLGLKRFFWKSDWEPSDLR